MESDRTRQIVAAFVGILIIIVLVLLARWTGDKIRERFLTPKPVAVSKEATGPVVNTTENQLQSGSTMGQATVSAIPSTGPADFGYFLIVLLLLSGLSLSALAKASIRRL